MNSARLSVFACLMHIVCIILVNLCPSIVRGQEQAFRHYSVHNGLSSTTVYSCMQDQNGYVWFATEAGVSRFDGKVFEHFSVDDGLADSEIFKIFQDKYKRIWFLSFNGKLSYYLNGKVYDEISAPFLKGTFCGQSFIGIKEDKLGRLWLSSFGHCVLLIDNEKVIKFDFSDGARSRSGVNIIIKPDGMPEFRSDRNIYSFDEATLQMKLTRTGEYDFIIYRPSHSESDTCFMVTREGILRVYKDEDTLVIPLTNEYSEANFSTVLYENDHQLWVGTSDDGVRHYELKGGTPFIKKTILHGAYLSDIIKDNEGNLWFCTINRGVYMLTPECRETYVYNTSYKPFLENLSSIFIDSRNRVWTGGESAIITVINTDSDKVHQIQIPFIEIPQLKVSEINEDKSGNVWLATSADFFRINNYKALPVVLTENPALAGLKAVKSISVNNSGEIFIAFYAGIAKYNPQTNSFDLLKNQGYPTRTFYSYAMADRLYVANINGLFEYKDEKLIPLFENDSRLRNRITCLNAIGDSILLISTSGHGVYFYKNNEIIQHLTKASGLPSNVCQKVFVDGDQVWIVTDKGLVHSKPENGIYLPYCIYRERHGLRSSDIRDVAVKNGKIFVASSQGLIVLDVIKRKRIPKPLNLIFTSCEVNNKAYPLDSTLNLEYFKNNISITFNAITFKNPFDVTYQYKFAGDDDSWNSTYTNAVTLSQLRPGAYNLLVRARSGDDLWSPPSSFNFVIMKPFWESVSFKIIVFLAAAGLLTLPFVMIQRRRTRNKEILMNKLAAIYEERQRISFDLHDDLGSSLTSIAMNTAILTKKKSDQLDFNLELAAISHESNLANEKITDIIWALSTGNDNLVSLVAYMNNFVTEFCSASGIDFEKQIQNDLPSTILEPRQRKNLLLTIKEAFHNIGKHSKAKKVVFQLFVDLDKILNIVIKDDGIGFDQTNIRKNGLGLFSMQSRMNSINGVFLIDTQDGKGTCITLKYVL